MRRIVIGAQLSAIFSINLIFMVMLIAVTIYQSSLFRRNSKIKDKSRICVANLHRKALTALLATIHARQQGVLRSAT